MLSYEKNPKDVLQKLYNLKKGEAICYYHEKSPTCIEEVRPAVFQQAGVLYQSKRINLHLKAIRDENHKIKGYDYIAVGRRND